MKKEHLREITGIFVFALSALFFLSFVSYHSGDLSFYSSHPNIPPRNLVHVFGATLSGVFFFVLGWSAYLVPVFLVLLGLKCVRHERIHANAVKPLGLLILFSSLSSFLAMWMTGDSTIRFARGGVVGLVFSDFLINYFGRPGAYVILLMLGLLSLPLIGEILILPFMAQLAGGLGQQLKTSGLKGLGWMKEKFTQGSLSLRMGVFSVKARPRPVARPAKGSPKKLFPKGEEAADQAKAGASQGPVNIKVAKPMPKTLQTQAAATVCQASDASDYRLPSLDLLESPPPVSMRRIKEDLTENAGILEETLSDFGIAARVADIEQGPVITRYELEPAPGVKVQRIVSLSDDIALTMKASSVRIVAPIPGKNRVGVEVPNAKTTMVYLKEVLEDEAFVRAGSKLALALAKDTAGKSVIADLGEMPHLLIAGTTGSGKTVCVNGIILSILFNAAPDEVKFLMIDPKMVELAPYNGLPHLLCPVVTDPKKAGMALLWLTQEMDERYRILAREGVRNIEAYNGKKQKLPYIVVVIDELADLMMAAKDHVESAIARLAQLSRAVGIHLVLATQRPSVDVITGVIKANFPSRISFKVASKVDSRTVLDMNGADKLLGRGDLLFLEPGEAKPVRAQGTFVKDKEIEGVLNFIKNQMEPTYDDNIMRQQEKSALDMTAEKDELFDAAAKLIIETGQASVSILQRRLRLGYTRAARLIDMMELDGLVGPYRGSKPREIIVDRQVWLKEQMQKEHRGGV